MSESPYANLFAAIKHGKQVREAQMTDRLANRPLSKQLDGFSRDDVKEQSVVDLVENLPHPVMMFLLYCPYDGSSTWTIEMMTGDVFQKIDAPTKLCGFTVSEVRRAVNHIIGGFNPYIEDPDIVRRRTGCFEMNAMQQVVERSKPPVSSKTVVTTEDMFVARSIAAITRPLTKTAYNHSSKELEHATSLKPSNSASIPLDETWAPLIGPLVLLDQDGVPWPVWEATRGAVLASVNLSGLSHLFWAYRVNEFTWNSPCDAPPPKFLDCLKFLPRPPWNRSQIAGFTKHSVWNDGSPVPSVECLHNGLKLMNITSVVGAFPSKLISYAKNTHWYGLSFSTPDPCSKVLTTTVDSKNWENIDAECFWNPPSHLAANWKGPAITIAVNELSQLQAIASKWSSDGAFYQTMIVFGGNPHVILKRVPESVGSPRSEMLAVLAKFYEAMLWVPLYNISKCKTGGQDVWSVEYSKGFTVHITSEMESYRYVPLVDKYVDRTIERLTEKVELTWSAVPRSVSPAYTPPVATPAQPKSGQPPAAKRPRTGK